MKVEPINDPTFRRHFSPFVHIQPRHPFYLRPFLFLYEIVKVSFAAVFLLPIRIFLICSTILITIGIFKIFSFGHHPVSKPLRGKRRAICEMACVICARICLFAMGFYRIKIIGKPDNRKGMNVPVLAGPHMGWQDIPLFTLLRVFSFVSKDAVRSVPLVGWAAWLPGECLFVDRFAKDSRQKTVQRIADRCRDPEAPRLILFPEGTTANGRQLLSFRLGAFRPGLPVQPVVIKYPHVIYNPVYTEAGIRWQLFRMLTQFAHTAEVHFLPIYEPSPEEIADPALYATNVRRLMAHAANLPLSPFSVGERKIFDEAESGKISIDEAIQKVAHLTHSEE